MKLKILIPSSVGIANQNQYFAVAVQPAFERIEECFVCCGPEAHRTYLERNFSADSREVLYYRPIFRITPLKSAEKKAVFSSSWILFQEDGALLPAQILGGQCRRDRAPMSTISFIPLSV